jgi:hypothetical protein
MPPAKYLELKQPFPLTPASPVSLEALFSQKSFLGRFLFLTGKDQIFETAVRVEEQELAQSSEPRNQRSGLFAMGFFRDPPCPQE